RDGADEAEDVRQGSEVREARSQEGHVAVDASLLDMDHALPLAPELVEGRGLLALSPRLGIAVPLDVDLVDRAVGEGVTVAASVPAYVHELGLLELHLARPSVTDERGILVWRILDREARPQVMDAAVDEPLPVLVGIGRVDQREDEVLEQLE